MSKTHTTENNRYLNQLAHKHEKIRQLEEHLKQSKAEKSKWVDESNRLGFDIHKLGCLNRIMSSQLFSLLESAYELESLEKAQDRIEELYELSNVIVKMVKASYEGLNNG